MALNITYNDAWEGIWLEFTGDLIDQIRSNLQPTHPLREIEFFPAAKVCSQLRFLLNDENDPNIMWLLDFQKRKRIKGKTYFWFKKLESQSELDQILAEDLQCWIQYMKDAGAWNEE